MNTPQIINREIRYRNWTQVETAKRLGISSALMSDILRGRRRVSVKLALRMERVLNINAGRILHAQIEDDLNAARR